MQGIPWKFTDEDLTTLFEGSGAVEDAKVVIGKDGRSRVSGHALAASPSHPGKHACINVSIGLTAHAVR